MGGNLRSLSGRIERRDGLCLGLGLGVGFVEERMGMDWMADQVSGQEIRFATDRGMA